MPTSHSIQIIDDLLILLDEEGNGCDSHELRDLRAADRQLRCWYKEHKFNFAAARHDVSEFFRACDDRPTRPAPRDPAIMNARLAEIAKHVLKVPPSTYRDSDRRDLFKVSVGQIKLALRAAYEAGRTSVM
ncbi:MAG: hypothetical protein KKE86_10745 [Planctomycetes bacterium]|nr:hypothetical protein [Planctomycetota bacterium]MBU4399799.1 hypothetical protein [Planctomycetota bacterium]MCG2684674.1 hypothetical protein [Planctomycetales bacterium]